MIDPPPHTSTRISPRTVAELMTYRYLCYKNSTELLFVLVFRINRLPKLFPQFFELFLRLFHKLVISFCHDLELCRRHLFCELCEVFFVHLTKRLIIYFGQFLHHFFKLLLVPDKPLKDVRIEQETPFTNFRTKII